MARSRPSDLDRRRFLSAALGATTALGLGTLESEALAADEPAWEPIDDADGIQVFRRSIPNSPLHAFRGTGVIEAALGKVFWVLADNEHRTEWVDRLVKSTVLKQNDDYDFVLYQHFRSPPLVADRDFVYRARAHTRADGVSVLDIASIPYPNAPPTVGVRGQLKFSSYRVKRIAPDKTHVDVSIALDPGGDLPAWVVNLVQKSWPMNTLKALRAQVKKPFVRAIPAPPRK